MGWVIEEVQLIGDVIAYFCAGVIIHCDIFSAKESVNPEDSSDFVLGYQHMYFAMMMVKKREIYWNEIRRSNSNQWIRQRVEYKDNQESEYS